MSIDAAPVRFSVEAVRRLPVIPNECWQLDAYRISGTLRNEDGSALAAFLPLVVSTARGLIVLKPDLLPQPADARTLADAFYTATARADGGPGARPAQIEVRGPRLAEELHAALDGSGTTVAVVDDLPAWNDAAAALAEQFGGPAPPGAFEDTDVTPEQMSAFCEAAAAAYRARPWDKLAPERLFAVAWDESHDAPPFFSVLGAAREVFGFGFLYSRRDFARMAKSMARPSRAWSIYFDSPAKLPWLDQRAFEEHAWPVAFKKAHPWVLGFGQAPGFQRPDSSRLADFEAFLRAITAGLSELAKTNRCERTVTVRGRERCISINVDPK